MSYTEIKCIKAFLHFSGGRKLMTQTCFFTLLWPWCSSLWGGHPTWKTFSHRLHQFCSWNHWNPCSRCYLKGWLHFSNFYCIFCFFPTAGLCPCGREHWLQLAAHTCNCTPRSWCSAHCDTHLSLKGARAGAWLGTGVLPAPETPGNYHSWNVSLNSLCF